MKDGKKKLSNEILILKSRNLDKCSVFLNGNEIRCVTDFEYKKNSAFGDTEFILKFDVSEITECFI